MGLWRAVENPVVTTRPLLDAVFWDRTASGSDHNKGAPL
jgi:hypothetical protein